MNKFTLILHRSWLDSVFSGLGISLKLSYLLVSAAVQLLEYTPKTYPPGLRALGHTSCGGKETDYGAVNSAE